MKGRFLRPVVVTMSIIFVSAIFLLFIGGCTRDEGDLSGPAPSDRTADVSQKVKSKYPKIVDASDYVSSRRMDLSATQEEVYFEDFEQGPGGWVPVDLTEQDGIFWQHFPGPVAAVAKVTSIIKEVEDLASAGILTQAQAKGLIGKLNEAIKNLKQGKAGPAVNKLQDFIDQVNGFINGGVLQPDEGQPLIDAAEAIIPDIGERGIWWCGIDSPYLCSPPGYGNNWYQFLTKPFQLPAGEVSLDYVIHYDTEPGYDFVWVQVSADCGVTFETLALLDGDSKHFVSLSSDLSAYANQDVVIRFTFTSDGGWSDEDGGYDSDGACRLDEVQVTGYPVDDFELGPDGWIASIAPAVGGGPFRLETELAGHADGHGHAWAAYDLDGPNAGLFPFTPQEKKDAGRWINIGIESPVIPIPADAMAYVLEFDVYRHLPLFNLVVYDWEIAARCPGEECWSYSLDGFVFIGYYPQWYSFQVDVTELVPPGATEMKIRLRGIDYWIFEEWYGIPFSGEHTPAPFFDNVRILVEMPSE